jgi:hypothetical protein
MALTHPYDGALYHESIAGTQGYVFLNIRNILPGVDEKWFIENYMKSHMRELLDEANPKFAAMPPNELIRWFIEREQNGEYKCGEEWGGFLPGWVGEMYGHFQWHYNIPSKQLIELLPLHLMERIYNPLHQMGYYAGAQKIHDEVLCLPHIEGDD